MANGSRIDRGRLLRDREYLLQAVCAEFQKVDTYHRGLITSANFSKALAGLGLRYGQPEVDDLLQYCQVTDDGYVHYKDLSSFLAPQPPRAKQSSLKQTLYPAEVVPPAPTEERNGFFAARTEDIRKVFSLWERGRISNDQFKEGLQSAGVLHLPEELDRLLVMYGPARSLPFSKLMYALQIDANDGRRARNALGVPPPVVLGDRRAGAMSVVASELRFHGTCASSSASLCDELSNPPSLRQAVCDFVDGHIPAVTFRSQLQRFGVALTYDLEKLIRTHESDSSVRFQDLARLLLRQDPEATTPSGNRSGATTPRSDLRARESSGPPSVVAAFSALPYASGGAWAESSLGYAAGPLQPRQPVQPVQPPYAVMEPEIGLDAASSASRRPRSQRAQGHGDILGWNQPPNHSEERASSRRRGFAPKESQTAFLQWPQAWQAPAEVNDRPGRRLYGRSPSASESAPFGRSCDVSGALVFSERPAVPFGTDRDLHLRPEDAGTDEYRASLGNRRR